jgi:hypothetical protein
VILYKLITGTHLILLKIYVIITDSSLTPESLAITRHQLTTLIRFFQKLQPSKYNHNYVIGPTIQLQSRPKNFLTTNNIYKEVAKSQITQHPDPTTPTISTIITKGQLGGASPTEIIEVETITPPLITRFNNVIYPAETSTKGIINFALHLQERPQWRPRIALPTRLGTHTLEQSLPESYQKLIERAISQDPNQVLLYWINQPAQHITSAHLRELMSHGSMTSDSVLNTFLEILCHDNPISYLSTFFISVLREHKNWSCLRNWFASSELATPSRPTQNSTRPILIPCHVNGVHWVGIVRRIIRNKVCFPYADDLNQETTRIALQQLLATTADAEFYPPNSIWINCKSVTHRPHSNECGPRVLLALTIMSLHPNPLENMLLPYMHNNIAQIC